MEPKEIKRTGYHHLGGVIRTLADVERDNKPNEEILRSNMRGNEIAASRGRSSMSIPRVTPRRDRLKLCSSCQEWLPVECFSKDRSRVDGRRGVCAACTAERSAELAAGATRRRPWATKRTITAMAEEAGLSPSTLGGRLLAGWELEEALTKPVAPSGRNKVRLPR